MIAAVISILVLASIWCVIARQPEGFQVTRSATFAAPAADIFPHINNLHQWQEWSPWAKLDPQAKEEFEGPPSGTGASMSWNGNNKVGQGRMTIEEIRADQMIKLRLDFMRPFKATNTAMFTFTPDKEKTKVEWTMSGTKNFISKAMHMVMDCDKMVGGQFDQGLASLKSIVEK